MTDVWHDGVRSPTYRALSGRADIVTTGVELHGGFDRQCHALYDGADNSRHKPRWDFYFKRKTIHLARAREAVNLLDTFFFFCVP